MRRVEEISPKVHSITTSTSPSKYLDTGGEIGNDLIENPKFAKRYIQKEYIQ